MKKFFRSIFLMALILALSLTALANVSALNVKAEVYTFVVEDICAEPRRAESTSFTYAGFYSLETYSGLYGDQLTGLAKEVYDSMVSQYVTGKNTTEYEHTFKTPFKFKAEVFMGTIMTNTALSDVKYEIRCAMQMAQDAFLYDHPELFWLRVFSTSYSISTTGSSYGRYTGTISSITIIPYENYLGATYNVELYNTAVEKAVSSIKVTGNRYQTLKSIHDYICNKAWYNSSSKNTVYTSEPIFIGNGGVVCEGYSEAFKIICDRLGIPCALIVGDAGGPHMWNYVQMDDGKWYLVDVTWDDSDDGISYIYFIACSNSTGASKKPVYTERTESGDFSDTGIMSFTYPELSSTAYTTHVHKWNSDYTVDRAPTCTEKGSKSIHCSDCDMKKNVTEIPAKNHKDTIIKVEAKTASCTAVGWNAYEYCSACDYTTYKEIAATGHKLITLNAVEATCTKDGLTAGKKCSVCGTVTKKQKTVKAEGHSIVTVKGKAATCTQTGLTDGKKCSACGEVAKKQEKIKATGHSFEAATCTRPKTCTICGETSGKYGHKYTNACDTTCNICNKKRSITHSYKTTTTRATLKKDGKSVKECTVCGKSETTVISYPKTVSLFIAEYVYNGKQQKPTLNVSDAKGKALKKGTDYTVEYEGGSKAPGKYTVTVTFIGRYSGTKKLTYTIAPKVTSKVTAVQSAKAIKLTWSKVTGADGYRIYQYNAKTKKWDNVRATDKTSCKIENLKAGTVYKFRIKAFRDGGDYLILGESTDTVSAATKPAAPERVSTAQSTKAVKLTWSKVTGADGYRVFRYNSKTKTWDKLVTLTATSFKAENLKSGTAYKFCIKAYKQDGDQILWSAATDITVATKPTAPKITKLTAAKSKVTLTWSDVNGENGYELYASTKKDSGFKKVATTKADKVKVTVSKLTSGKTYYFKVRAYKTVGETKVYSAWSAVKSVKIK